MLFIMVDATKLAGWLMVSTMFAVHPFISVTTTEYIPALRLMMSWEVAPLLQA